MIEYRQFQPDDAEQCRALILSCIDDFEGVGQGGHERFRRKIKEYPYILKLDILHQTQLQWFLSFLSKLQKALFLKMMFRQLNF